MKTYHFSEMIARLIMGLNGAKLLKIHQASNGWVVILKDELDGQEYIGTFYPVRSEKMVAPNTVDQLLNMQGDQ